ncbi:calcium-activated chloride channel regulator 1-like [Diadema antillarum]|uniref:calcium-activated chloride channel regulator 1-like n=1 Tax=Diadema antillarum TaxID=105358 RepID=UPI003A86380D
MNLQNGRYTNILVAIDSDVEEDDTLIEHIKETFKTGSGVLFNATDHRLYWGEIQILVPITWSRKPDVYETATHQTFGSANIRVVEGAARNPSVTNHAGCGKPGLDMTLTSGYLLQNVDTCSGKAMVREWGRLRWSLFPEHFTGSGYGEANQYYDSTTYRYEPTRCSPNLSGDMRDGSGSKCLKQDTYGKVDDACVFTPYNDQTANASLLFGSHCVDSDFNRIDKLIQSSAIFIRHYIPAGSHLGIVTFDTDATTKADLTLVQNDYSSRDDLVNRLPPDAEGWTCIGCGIETALNVLGDTTNGSYILLLSDGIENRSPYIRETIQAVMEAGVVIDTIAVTNDADEQMENLTSITGGKPFFCPDGGSSACLAEAFLSTVSDRPDQNFFPTPFQVLNEDVNVSASGQENRSFVISEEEGNDTVIAVTRFVDDDVEVIVGGPNGEYFNKNSLEYDPDTQRRIVYITIPIAENVDHSTSPMMGVYGIVQQNYQPVPGARVVATIQSSIGTTSLVEMFDSGTGFDKVKDDGIYSGVFTDFHGDGRYSVTVRVQGMTIEQQIESSRRLRRAVGTTVAPSQTEFMRSASGGAFVVENYSPTAPDILAPSTITDLRHTELYNISAVRLVWTAVGDDFDHGRVSSYELRYCTDFTTLRTNFTECTLVDNDQLVEGNLSDIATAGVEESITVQLLEGSLNVSHHFSLRASDEAGNVGPTSNIVSTAVIIAPPATTTLAPTATRRNDLSSSATDTTSMTTDLPNEKPFNKKILIISLSVVLSIVVIGSVETFKTGSGILFQATNQRLYWGEIQILVPITWSRKPDVYETATFQSFGSANIWVVEGAVRDPSVTNHAGCGVQGLDMTLTSGYLLQNVDTCSGKAMVREWGRLRWSLFPEHFTDSGNDNAEANQYFDWTTNRYEPTRCSPDLSGDMRDESGSKCLQQDTY